MSTTPRRLTIPTPDELRADIRRQAAELRAKRKLLRLSEAAQSVSLSMTDTAKHEDQDDQEEDTADDD
jgi:hypothetical protein